jgi:hypothetical protein
MAYKLLRKTKNDAEYRLMNYCYSKEYAIKLISLYKKRKIIRLGEKRSLMKTALWKIVPITRYEAVMAQKDVPF